MSRTPLLSLLLIAACGGSDSKAVDAPNAVIDSAVSIDAPPGTPDAQVFDAKPTPDAKPSSVKIVTCPASGTVDVVASNFMFDKATYAVAVDGIVKFTVASGAHTMTATAASSDAFDSGTLTSTSDPVCFQFTAAGGFPFHCSIHTSMTATVTVQ
ncbi:MAG: hypothetical protein K8W52_24575 [Deltaproteobacteria bacterium]|nr:hypothetical protein [Deltaproteobacteria bacterium]